MAVLTMTFGEFESEIRSYCREPSITALPQATIMLWANLLQLDFCKRTHILRGGAIASSVEDRAAYGPFDEVIGNPDLVTYDSKRLGPTTRRQLHMDDATWYDDTGTPEAYFFEGNILNIYPPPPDDDKTIKIHFPIRPQKITATSDNFDVAVEYIEALLHGVANRVFALRGKSAQARDEMVMYEALVEDAKIDVDSNTPEENLRMTNVVEYYE